MQNKEKPREEMEKGIEVEREIKNSLNVRGRFEARHYGEDPLSDLPNLKYLHRISHGNYGVIFKAKDRGCRDVAVKRSFLIEGLDDSDEEPTSQVFSDKLNETFDNSIRAQKACQGKGVVEIYDSGIRRLGHYIVMEYCPNGDLMGFVRDKGTPRKKERLA